MRQAWHRNTTHYAYPRALSHKNERNEVRNFSETAFVRYIWAKGKSSYDLFSIVRYRFPDLMRIPFLPASVIHLKMHTRTLVSTS